MNVININIFMKKSLKSELNIQKKNGNSWKEKKKKN